MVRIIWEVLISEGQIIRAVMCVNLHVLFFLQRCQLAVLGTDFLIQNTKYLRFLAV